MKKIFSFLLLTLLFMSTAHANVKITGTSSLVSPDAFQCQIGNIFTDTTAVSSCASSFTMPNVAHPQCPPNQYTISFVNVGSGGAGIGYDTTSYAPDTQHNCVAYVHAYPNYGSWSYSISVTTVSDPITNSPTNNKFVSQAAQDAIYCPKCAGDPVNIASGEEVQAEPDISPSPNGVLAFTRYYSSQTHVGDFHALGRGWRDNYSRTMDVNDNATNLTSSSIYSTAADACTSGWGEVSASSYRGIASGATASYSNGLCQLTLNGSVVGKLSMQITTSGPSTSGVIHTITRPNGRAYVFEQNGSAWQERYGASVTLVSVTDGWLFTDKDGTQEHYNNIGHLTTITDPAGHIQTLSYDGNGRLSSVSDAYNRQLTFTYDGSGHIATVTDPNGGIYHYGYDSTNRLISVSYPDSTSTITSDNPTRHYLYENSSFPSALTGITDENGKRFATLTYDAQQRVLSSEHAGGEGHINFTYNSDGSTTLTYANGRVETYHFSVINGSLKVTSVTNQ